MCQSVACSPPCHWPARRSTRAGKQHQLGRRGFLRYERYRGFTLTSKGAAVAKRQVRRSGGLIEFFNFLGLDAANAARAVEGMEHHLSDAALSKLEFLVAEWRRSPANGKLLRQLMNERAPGKLPEGDGY